MVAVQDPKAGQYSEWAAKELPRIRAKIASVEAAERLSPLDEALLSDEFSAPSSTSLGRPNVRSVGGGDSWLPYLIALSLGALIFMIGLIIVGSFSRAFFGENSEPPPREVRSE